MALVITMVFGLQTGIAGAILVVLIVTVSAFSGWLVGLHQRIQKRNYYSYMKGYQEGLSKKTLVIRHPDLRFSITLSDNESL